MEMALEKSICIVGAGTAGLALIKALLDVPLDERKNWEIVVFEKQDSVGGIWVPDPLLDPEGVKLPLSPLYPQLMTNTPVPMMTFPNFPFPPGTPLYPSHEHAREYHRQYAAQFKLDQYILVNHEVVSASWQGDSQSGKWSVGYQHDGVVETKTFDHLCICAGINHYPVIPTWPGQAEWLAAAGPGERKVIHATWFRDPLVFSHRSVLIVGAAASAIDIANMVSPVANKTYIAMRSVPDEVYGPTSRLVAKKPDVSYFTENGVAFADGTFAGVDTVILGTGYEKRISFLEATKTLLTDHSATLEGMVSPPTTLITNLRYIFPVHKHVFSLASAYPTNALAFAGLNTAKVGNAMMDAAQGIYIAKAISNPDFLPPREQLIQELLDHHQEWRNKGVDPYVLGHSFPPQVADDYQDSLVASASPELSRKFVEVWRRNLLSIPHIKSGWKRLEKLEKDKEWLYGVETESDWWDLMKKVDDWEKQDCTCETYIDDLWRGKLL